MGKFFTLFPTIQESDGNIVTDLAVRIKIQNSWLNNPKLYYNYNYQDHDKPEDIAKKYYNDPDLHWIVLLTNNIFDPNFDFPMSYDTFQAYLNDKYYTQGQALGLTGSQYAQITPDPVYQYQKQVTIKYPNNPDQINYYVIDKNTYMNLEIGRAHV